jgi:hypothetical protein
MNERDFDRVIDAATQQIVGHAPPESLTDAVMRQVRSMSDDSRAQKRYGPFLARWATIGLCATACVVATYVLLSRSPESMLPSPIRSSSIQLTAEQHASAPAQRDAASAEGLRRPGVAPITLTASQPPITQAEFDAIEPIVLEPIAPQPIDLAAIAIEAPVIDRLVVEPIVIESLSASND